VEVVALALRVGLSLAAVLGLIWLFSRGMQRGQGSRMSASARVRVLSRQPLGRNAGVAVVKVGERALVLGVTDGQISLLTDLPVGDVVDEAEELREALAVDAEGVPTVGVPPQRDDATGPLAGSVLSPATWTQAVDALRERTTRR